MTSKIANEPSQLKRGVEQRAGIERIPPQQEITDKKENPPYDLTGDDLVSPQEMPDSEKIPSE